MELYLITGFLGAGKTSFLKNFIRQFCGKQVQLIINEFGKIGIDGAILQEINAVMREITNGSIFCACRLDKFEEELHRCIANKPDVILVEASGLSDPTSIQTILNQDAFSSICYCGSICLVDTIRLEKVLHTARMCSKQLGVSSLILLNKTDLATPEQLAQAYAAVRTYNPVAAIRETSFGFFDTSWIRDIQPLNGTEAVAGADICLQKQLIMVEPTMTIRQLNSVLHMIAEECWRIKGVVYLEDRHLLVDCVGSAVQVTDTEIRLEEENLLVLLAGSGMALRQAVKQAMKWYPGLLHSLNTRPRSGKSYTRRISLRA